MKVRLMLLAAFFIALPLCAQNSDEAKREKEFFDYIQEEVDRQTLSLGLAGWQVFLLDSTLTHDYTAMREEVKELSVAKVSNNDLYQKVQDKWYEQIYNTYRRILDDEQWAKYLKKGGAREKKARDKRMSKQ